jgi:hypothetical protein
MFSWSISPFLGIYIFGSSPIHLEKKIRFKCSSVQVFVFQLANYPDIVSVKKSVDPSRLIKKRIVFPFLYCCIL